MVHTKDIHRPSPWTSSQAVGVAAGFKSSALMTRLYLCGKVVTLASWYSLTSQRTENTITEALLLLAKSYKRGKMGRC